MQMHARWTRVSWTSDAVVCYLPCSSIQFRCILSVHKFWHRLSWSGPKLGQCQQTIMEFVSITRISKQRSPISIVHRSPVKMRKETETTPSQATLPYCIIGTFGLVRMWRDHVPRGFVLQSDWLLRILRGNGRQKIDENATRPLFRFFGRSLGTRLASHHIYYG